MSWLVVAKRTVLDPYRSRYLWVVLGIVGLLFGAGIYVVTSTGVVPLLVGLGSFFVPLLAIACGYRTIAEPRQTGSLRVILSYPHSRRDVVVGTVVGRSVLTGLIVTVGFLVAGVVALFGHGLSSLGPILLVWLPTLLLVVSMTSVAVGISAAARTVNRAATGAVAAVLLFFGGWNWIPTGIRSLLNGFSRPPPPQPAWVDVFVALNPTRAFSTLVGRLLPAMPVSGDGVQTMWWFGALVLVGWAIVPLVLGSWVFERSDL